ncbi:hypothetical protein [Chelatococcus reniformis]|uniref:PE-PGRS family protein n=1 Tax=Chelatococcus reniformis TaxID=1494448 RepID=A0A916UXL5_9HYPH|nr:hypothetical protein [Chelatococcus reniformis]GGC92755.1 hypothetical protein GCM10010994_58220 [Chelatococcus reniformis]
MKTAQAMIVAAAALLASGPALADAASSYAGAFVVAQSTGGNQGTDRPGPGGGPIATGRDAQGNYGSQSTGGNQATDKPGPGGGPIDNSANRQGNKGCQSTGGNPC